MKYRSPLSSRLSLATLFVVLTLANAPAVFAQDRTTICTAAAPISLSYEFRSPALGGEEPEYTSYIRLFPNGFASVEPNSTLISCRHIGVFAVDSEDSKNIIQGRLTHLYDSLFDPGFFTGVYSATFRFGITNACKTFRIYIVAEDGTVSSNSLEFRLTCASPDVRLDLQKAKVEELISQGILSQNSGSNLIDKIEKAKEGVLEGDMRKAANHLKTFVSNVESLVKSKKIPQALGQPLIDRATSIINQIT
jgi:hypothetical protein